MMNPTNPSQRPEFVAIAEALLMRAYPLAVHPDDPITLPRRKLQRLLIEAAAAHQELTVYERCDELEGRAINVAGALRFMAAAVTPDATAEMLGWAYLLETLAQQLEELG